MSLIRPYWVRHSRSGQGSVGATGGRMRYMQETVRRRVSGGRRRGVEGAGHSSHRPEACGSSRKLF